MSPDPNTSMPNIHISVWHGVCYVHEAWDVGSTGTCHALRPPTCHIFAVDWHYSKVSRHILYFITCKVSVLPNIYKNALDKQAQKISVLTKELMSGMKCVLQE